MDQIKHTFHSNDIVRVLKVPSFLSLMLSEFFSQIAFNMQHFVLIFLVYEVTRSNTAVSGIILSFTIPAILFSLLAGVFVDRWNKKTVLFTTNVVRGILLLLFLIPNLHPAGIYALTFVIAVATQFFLPAEGSVIPILSSEKLLVSANAVFSAGIFTTVLIGYVLSGPILLLFGKDFTFVLLAGLFFVSALCILPVTIPKKKKVPESIEKSLEEVTVSLGAEIKEIFSFIKKAGDVAKALTVLTFSQAIIFTFAALGPGYLSTILKVRVESLSWIVLAPAALGMVSGAVVLGSIGKRLNHHILITGGFLVSGIIMILFTASQMIVKLPMVDGVNALLPSFFDVTALHIIMVLSFFAGVANSCIFVPSNTTIQKETNDEIRGRIYGFLNALVGSVSLLPVALAGGLADAFGVAQVITGIGIIMLFISLGSYFL